MQALELMNSAVLGFFKDILVYMENKGKNRRWYVFESIKFSFSKCWFREYRVKISFVEKYVIYERFLYCSRVHFIGSSRPPLPLSDSYMVI